MARKLRLEFPGAIYHVINRGNDRAFVFKSVGARQAFEDCLFVACERSAQRQNHFPAALPQKYCYRIALVAS